jgi:hypothetical protein
MTNHAWNWTVELAFYGDTVTWGEYDPTPGTYTVTLRDLPTGSVSALTGPGVYKGVAIWGDWVYWEEQLDGSDSLSRELFRKNVTV